MGRLFHAFTNPVISDLGYINILMTCYAPLVGAKRRHPSQDVDLVCEAKAGPEDGDRIPSGPTDRN